MAAAAAAAVRADRTIAARGQTGDKRAADASGRNHNGAASTRRPRGGASVSAVSPQANGGRRMARPSRAAGSAASRSLHGLVELVRREREEERRAGGRRGATGADRDTPRRRQRRAPGAARRACGAPATRAAPMAPLDAKLLLPPSTAGGGASREMSSCHHVSNPQPGSDAAVATIACRPGALEPESLWGRVAGTGGDEPQHALSSPRSVGAASTLWPRAAAGSVATRSAFVESAALSR